MTDRTAASGAPRLTYLDHAATTPMVTEALEAMSACLGIVGNPSSLHASGRTARRLVEESRESLAASLGARPSEVIFTGGGTESDNLAVKGLFWARHGEDPARRRILASAVEHHAVMDPALWLAEHEGALIEWLPVDGSGRVHPDTIVDGVVVKKASCLSRSSGGRNRRRRQPRSAIFQVPHAELQPEPGISGRRAGHPLHCPGRL